jgi:hypothetical protein
MRLHRPFLKTILLISLSVWLSACGGGGGGGTSPVSNTKVLADNFDSGALATGVWKQSLDGDNRSILDGRLVNKVTSSGPQVSINTTFIRDYTYIETTVRISSDSVISVGARGKARLAGYFYNDRRGPGSGLPYNGVEGDVWGQVEVNLRDDGTLFAKAFLGPDDADGINSIATFLDQTFSTSVQFDTDYVMSIEQTADDRFILTFNGESFIYQETGPMYPISELSYQGFTARIYAGGTGGTLLVEWDDVYVSKINNVQMLPVEFKYLLYDDFSDPGGNIDFTLWDTQGGATAASTLEIVGGSLIATAVKDAGVRADQGLWVANATNVSLTDFQAFRADFTILEATGNATNRAQILLGLPLENAGFFVDTGINFYASGEVIYFIEIFTNLGLPTTDIVSGTIATVDPAVTHTLSIGWDGSNYIFQVDNIVPIIIPMSAETDISNANSWSWAAVRATVKDTGTGTTVAKIDNVQGGSHLIYSIGDTGPAGGIVFYVTDGGLHGLEAAPVDQSATAPWGCFGKDIAGAEGTTIGTGAQNTADILVDCAELGIAARLADNYSLNGFNDWFLPSQDELNELYLQRAIVGGFTAIDGYWSSSEEFSSSAWVQSFQNGRQYNLEKSDNTFTGTRAVRAF